MKKSLPLLFLILFITTQTFSQHRQRFGVNAGINYSKFRGMDVRDNDYDFGIGYLVGVSYEYYFKENLSIKANLSYDKKSSRGSTKILSREQIDDPVGIVNVTYAFNYYYMTLPVLLKYEFKNAHGFFVNGGLFFGYLIDSEFVGKTTDGVQSESYTQSTTNLNNQFDFGFTTGIGKTFQLNNRNNLVVEFRNNLGLSQTNKNNTFNGNNVRSNSYNLIVGYAFDL
jgi:Outer membrane protein beta-barrel domain